MRIQHQEIEEEGQHMEVGNVNKCFCITGHNRGCLACSIALTAKVDSLLLVVYCNGARHPLAMYSEMKWRRIIVLKAVMLSLLLL